MFEQSLLAGENAAHKTRALAASFGAQSLVICIAILIPLIFSDHLPAVSFWTPLSAPLRSAPDIAPPVKSSAGPSSASILHSPSRIFAAAPRARSAGQVSPTVIGDVSTIDADATSYAGPPGVLGGLNGVPSSVVAASLQVHIAPAPIVKPPEKPQHVGGDVQAAKLIRKIVPPYPPLARQARVSGTVRLTGVIAKDGTIQQLEVLSGNPLLVPAALAAVKQWLYQPTFLNGLPVEVIAPIDVIFTLSQ